MLSQLGAGIAGIVDSIMVGHYSTTALAAVSFANSIFFTLMVFSMGALMGITPLVGYAFVQKDEEKLSELWRCGLTFALILVLLMIGILIGIGYMMPYMGQEEEIVRACVPYYILATVSTIPFLLYHFEKQYLEGLGNTTIVMVVTIAMNILNIPLNWLFIFGHCGCPALGATGAGIATLIVRTLQPILVFWVMMSRSQWRRLMGGCCSIRDTWSVAKIGLPIGCQQTMEIFAFTFSVILVGWIGKEAVAAHQITNNLADMFFMVSLGIGAAATIRVSHQYGERRIHDMHMAARAAIHMGLVWSLLTATVCFIGSDWLPRIFTDDEQVIAIASPIIILCGLFQISDALQCIGGAMLRGIADVRVPMYIAFLVYIIICLPLGYVLMFPLGLGVQGMWIAFIVGLTTAAVLLHVRWNRIAPKEEPTC